MKVKNYEIQQKRMKLLLNIIYYLEILLTLVTIHKISCNIINFCLILKKTKRFLLTWKFHFNQFCPCHAKWTKLMATYTKSLTNTFGIKVWTQSFGLGQIFYRFVSYTNEIFCFAQILQLLTDIKSSIVLQHRYLMNYISLAWLML